MSTAHELLTEFFNCLRNLSTSVDRCANLFAEDGVFEFPYVPTIGIRARFQGHGAIRGVLELIRSHFPSFTLSNIEIHELKDGSGLFLEYHSESFVDGSNKVYAQDYVSHLVVENSKIKLLREYLNVISSARALLPKGLADVPAPANWVLAQAPHAPAARAVSRGGFRRAPA
jgi:ketosteroid isomerase-like protein